MFYAGDASSLLLLLLCLGFIFSGLFFKIGFFPFHSWVPDVYAGSPFFVTALFAYCTQNAVCLYLI